LNLEEVTKNAFQAVFSNKRWMEWEDKKYQIKHSARGLRFINIERYIFQEQNPKKNSVWGQLVRDGHHILWIIEDGDYVGQVMDGIYRNFADL
jgi:ribosomal protein L28